MAFFDWTNLEEHKWSHSGERLSLAIYSDHIALLKQCETFYPSDEAAAESIRVEQLEYTT